MSKAKRYEDPKCAKCGGVMQDTDFIADDGTGECCIPHRIGRVLPATHTPGPWENSHGTIMAAAGKVAEAGNPGYDGFAAESEGEAIANARLIAAAPDLLAALKSALPWLTLLGDYIGNGVESDKHMHSVPVGPMGRCDTILSIKAAIARATGGGA